MVKMAAAVVIFCEALLLVLSPVSALQRLDSIYDLMNIDFGQSVPTQGLVLLHWFANTIDIDYSGMRLTFDPSNDFGSHHYGNYEGLLGRTPQGYLDYTVGNIYEDTEEQLPDHIRNPQTYGGFGGNSARIIFRVRGQVIDEVYLTQHHGHAGTEYDPQHTYRITINLMRQLRSFPMDGNYNSLRDLRDHHGSNVDDKQLWNIQQEWGSLACLGLLLLIVIPPAYVNQSCTVPEPSRHQSTNGHQSITIPEPDSSQMNSRPRSYNSSNQSSTDTCCCMTCILISVAIIIFLVLVVVGII